MILSLLGELIETCLLSSGYHDRVLMFKGVRIRVQV